MILVLEAIVGFVVVVLISTIIVSATGLVLISAARAMTRLCDQDRIKDVEEEMQ